jgi:hypothetical protein
VSFLSELNIFQIKRFAKDVINIKDIAERFLNAYIESEESDNYPNNILINCIQLHIGLGRVLQILEQEIKTLENKESYGQG